MDDYECGVQRIPPPLQRGALPRVVSIHGSTQLSSAHIPRTPFLANSLDWLVGWFDRSIVRSGVHRTMKRSIQL